LQLTGEHSLLDARHFFPKSALRHREMSQMLNRKHPAIGREVWIRSDESRKRLPDGADVRPDFNWSRQPIAMMGYR